MKTINRRNALLGRVHQLAKSMKLEGESYRTVLMCHTGKRSSKDLDLTALQSFINALERLAKGEGPDEPLKAPIASSETLPPAMRPTPKQWEMLEGLAHAMGWEGLRDSRLLTFVDRTTAAYSLEEMTRKQVSECITGLVQWREQIKAREAKA